MTPVVLSPQDASARVDAGALLVDIRSPDEHARERIPGARNVPVDRLKGLPTAGALIFHCRSGMRTAANAAALRAAAGDAECYVLGGGIDSWRAAGLPVEADHRQPIEIMRQVQIGAGALVLLGVLLGALVAPGFYAVPAFVGAGLTFAGVTGWCGMAQMLRIMPWNRRATTLG